MDLQEWELLPDEGFLEINDDGGKKLLYTKASTTSDFQMNYFICPPKESLKNQFLPVPIHLEKPQPQDEVVDQEKEAIKIIPVESTDMMMMMPATASEKKMKPVLSSGGALGADQDPAVSQVFFKKMKETEFVDMKVESPRGGTSSWGIMPQIEGAGVFQFEEKGGDDLCNKVDVEAEMVMNKMELGLEESDEDGINIWKWSLTGIGAICSFGVAVCIIILSSHRKNKYGYGKLRFQIYTDDKRMKQQVIEGGDSYNKKITEAMRAVRGVPNPMSMTTRRARITYGGYYDASSV
ncbi:UNVERIFIED_CONTAM: hypothetical protein Slati_3040600 [Sesamum latifolium]|uniref:DUF6821 domain-containing protein n=1 Tax=Sesamum latifolium TaxID=2727402 RepID=A0AAW2VHL6_9LAMI